MSATSNLDQWLARISASHPSEIELGLARVKNVWTCLQQQFPSTRTLAKRTVMIAGTNGKGTTAFTLANLLLQQGQRVGVYSSPHILRYNERVQVNGQMLSDEALIHGFECVEAARAETPLTYFEFGTLAAFVCLAEQDLDVAILEIGLGGRLDAVNIVDADIALITSVGLDHIDWLGDDLEQIAFEKAGILRKGGLALLGEDLPARASEYAAELGARYWTLGEEFGYTEQSLFLSRERPGHRQEAPLSLPLPGTFLPLNNLCLAVQAFLWLQDNDLEQTAPQLSKDIEQALAKPLSGRMECLQQMPEVVTDVCHNPHAAEFLAGLIRTKWAHKKEVYAVYSSLDDKDIAGVAKALGPCMTRWYVAPLSCDRAADIKRIETEVGNHAKDVVSFPGFDAALDAAIQASSADTLVLVFGSFYVVELAKSRFEESPNATGKSN